MAELVRVKQKFQVTIPVQVRKAAEIQAGDYLEVTAVPEGILLKPQRLTASKRSTRTILDLLADSHGVGRTQAQIDADINAQRNEW